MHGRSGKAFAVPPLIATLDAQTTVPKSGTTKVADRVAACLNPILTSRGFRYYTSFTHFRRNVGTRTDFVGLDVSTFAGNPYNLTFRFSVRFEEV